MNSGLAHSKTHLIKADQLDLYLQGEGWLRVLEQLGGFGEAVSMFRQSKSRHANCPFPENHTSSGGVKKFRLREKHGVFKGGAICTCTSRGWSSGYYLLMDKFGWSFPQCLAEINHFLGDPCGVNVSSTMSDEKRRELQEKRAREAKEKALKAEQKLARENEAKKKRLTQVYNDLYLESHPAYRLEEDSIVNEYLRSRGISPKVLARVNDNLRFNDALDYFQDEGEPTKYPALIGVFQNKDGQATTLHRVYMTPTGEKLERKMMPPLPGVPMNGGAIKLADINGSNVLGVTEGIETALAVMARHGMPVWSCVNTFYLSQFSVSSLPEHVDTLVIWADKDVSGAGLAAANELADKVRSAGLTCLIKLPESEIPNDAKSLDWNDVFANEILIKKTNDHRK